MANKYKMEIVIAFYLKCFYLMIDILTFSIFFFVKLSYRFQINVCFTDPKCQHSNELSGGS